MKGKVTISYHWSNNENSKARIKKEHREALEESAINRATECIKEGYGQGELHDSVRMSDKDGPDGVSYSGWWSVKYSK